MGLITDGFSSYPDKWNGQVRLYPHDRLFRSVLLRFFPKSVRPNHLTIVRLVLVVPVMALLLAGEYGWGLAVFLLAGLTDALDGSLARTRRQVSEWGIVWDPMADKILVGTVVAVIAIDLINPHLGLALILVELAVFVAGWLRARKGDIVQANFWGKAKMIFEVIGLTLLLLAAWLRIDLLIGVSANTLGLALVFAIVNVLVRIR
ncbi:CDP-alcohol phosphatidyltransferase family protein [Candidatus Uhrbacteria bacterium]|nr:CDP-alcohol phosphatidyltransferase family protein [Candidatus Uhrbacteria bacterium]